MGNEAIHDARNPCRHSSLNMQQDLSYLELTSFYHSTEIITHEREKITAYAYPSAESRCGTGVFMICTMQVISAQRPHSKRAFVDCMHSPIQNCARLAWRVAQRYYDAAT